MSKPSDYSICLNCQKSYLPKDLINHKFKPSESTKDKIDRLVAEAVEARQHNCNHCGHHGSKHAFDYYPLDEKSPEPCWKSCMVCFDNQTERLKKEDKLK